MVDQVGHHLWLDGWIGDLERNNFPASSMLIETLLMCMIAATPGRTTSKNLIIVPDNGEDLPLLNKLTFWTLTSVLGVPPSSINRVRVKPRDSISTGIFPDEAYFLRSIFQHSSTLSQDDILTAKSKPRLSRSRPPPLSALREQATQAPGISKKTTDPPPFLHSYSDPTPLPLDQVTLPTRVILVTGLETAYVQHHRALARVLRERQIRWFEYDDENLPSGTWHLLPNCIVVYIAPGFGTLDRALLDHFAMNTVIKLRPETRASANALFYSTHSQTSTPQISTIALASDDLNQPARNPAARGLSLSHELYEYLCYLFQHTYLPPQLSLYLSDLCSTLRHHPQIHGQLLTARARLDAEELVRAARIMGNQSPGTELIEHLVWKKLNPLLDTSPVQLDGGDTIPPAEQALADIKTDQELIEKVAPPDIDFSRAPESLAVSEKDIERMFSHLFLHRVRFRDGPHCEILGSAVFGATHPIFRRDPITAKLMPEMILRDILVALGTRDN